MLSGKWQPVCLGLNVLSDVQRGYNFFGWCIIINAILQEVTLKFQMKLLKNWTYHIKYMLM